jgi:hypothetical protein
MKSGTRPSEEWDVSYQATDNSLAVTTDFMQTVGSVFAKSDLDPSYRSFSGRLLTTLSGHTLRHGSPMRRVLFDSSRHTDQGARPCSLHSGVTLDGCGPILGGSVRGSP